jgi:hypothetical protein
VLLAHDSCKVAGLTDWFETQQVVQQQKPWVPRSFDVALAMLVDELCDFIGTTT